MQSRLSDFHHSHAFSAFRLSLTALDTTDGLLRAATASTLNQLDDYAPWRASLHIREIANEVLRRIGRWSIPSALTQLHAVLFDELGFRGHYERYDLPLNALIPAVLRMRRGIPLTLSLVYKAVAEQIGLTVHGIAAPNYFFVRVASPGDAILVDPFRRGRILTDSTARHRIAFLAGRQLAEKANLTSPCSHRKWLRLLLAHLERTLAVHNAALDVAAIGELRKALA